MLGGYGSRSGLGQSWDGGGFCHYTLSSLPGQTAWHWAPRFRACSIAGTEPRGLICATVALPRIREKNAPLRHSPVASVPAVSSSYHFDATAAMATGKLRIELPRSLQCVTSLSRQIHCESYNWVHILVVLDTKICIFFKQNSPPKGSIYLSAHYRWLSSTGVPQYALIQFSIDTGMPINSVREY